MPEFFVTGTDTGVGKTLVATALLHAAGARGLRTLGLKPVAAGCSGSAGRRVNEDALALQAAATVRLDYGQVNPLALGQAIAPHLAAAAEGLRLEVAPLARAVRSTAAVPHDLLLAEGAGGWLVPLNERETMGDLAAALGWPVILVVAMRLGCLNHALLTAAAVRAAGLSLAGWVANCAGAPMAALEANVSTLQTRLGARLIGCVPWLGAAAGAAAAAAHLDFALLPGMSDARV
jgi:dethiobiotin synthetase